MRYAACVAVYEDGSAVLCLRSDMDEDRLHRACLHELQHLVDLPLVRSGMSVQKLEWRATATEQRLARL